MRLVHCWLVVLVVLLGTGCASQATLEESPLATWDTSTSGSFTTSTVGTGTLVISDRCVRLVLDNQKTVLLLWPEPTSWNASSQVIEFVGVRGERVAVRHGDRVRPGGATAIREPPFVSPPDPACQADEAFIVNSLSVE